MVKEINTLPSSQGKPIFNNTSRLRARGPAALFVLFCLFALFTLGANAQSASGVTGVVTDTSGALVPGVEVKLTDTKTSRELTTATNDQGVYTFRNIPQGTGYVLVFSAAGFQRFVLSDVQLGIGRIETYNVQLSAGDVAASVQVTSTTQEATLNTTDPSLGNVISERQLRELPIQLRDNPASLIGLQPGVIGNNVGTGATNRVGSVTGARADQGNITVDGIDSNDVATGQAFVTIGNLPVDSVQEFRAVTTNPNSSEGRSSGGQIQLGTRSGSNEFHGSLREYFRTDKTAANTFFNNRNGIDRPRLQRHQFGGSISGPLPYLNLGELNGPLFKSGRDRVFFFFDYEGRRDDSETTATRVVPLQHVREGRIAYMNNTPACLAIPLNQIRLDTNPQCISFASQAQSATLDPQGVGVNQQLLSFINSRYPAANDPSGGNGLNTGLLRFNAPVVLNNNTYTGRIDVNITDLQRAFGRLTLTRNDQTNTAQLFPGDADSEQLLDDSYQFVGGHTWVITPSFTNQFTAGISRQLWDFPVPSSDAFPTIFTFGPLQAPYADISFQNRDVNVPTFRNDSTWTAGSHTVIFGAQLKPIRQKSVLINDFNFATLGLGGNTNALNATLRPSDIRAGATSSTNWDNFYTFMLGRLAQLNTNYVYDRSGNVQPLGTGKSRDYVYNEYELYVQDNWKIRSDLSLNAGVRWHFYPAPYERNGFQSGNSVDFDELLRIRVANGNAGIGGDSAEPLLTYDLIGKANGGRPMYDSDWNNFAPRFGFAYNPSFRSGFLGAIFGDRKTVIRGGASQVFDRVGGALSFIQDQGSYIFDNSAATSFGALNPRTALLNDPRFNGIGTLPFQNTPPVSVRPFTPDPFGQASGQFNYAIARNFEVPYSYQWSFGIQRELPGNMLLDVSYVGRRGRKLLAQSDAAQIVDFRDGASGQFMLAAFNNLQSQLNNGSPITAQPWLENQIGPMALANYGMTCPQIGQNFLGFNPLNCTELIAGFLPDLVSVGGTADLVSTLFSNFLLDSNIGLSRQFASNAFITNQGFSQYDGLLVSLRKRFSNGFQYDLNYTWSKAIDNQSSVTNAVIGGLMYSAIDRNAGKGNADFNLPHLFNANGIWELPIGRGRSIGGDVPRWANVLIGGWSVSGIFTARSGLPFSIFSDSYPVSYYTPDLLGVPAVLVGNNTNFAVNIRDDGQGIQYFADPAAVQAAFRYPRHGEIGNRNVLRSQAYWNIDLVLSKKFKMPWSEGHNLTFRAEAYNLTNTNFFAPPNRLYNTAAFGRITASQSDPRVLQFALRYDF
ncbi:MAG: carboxypeptidase regulatory-like domain-containing protein [Pyrinomonadaceae bacterium]